MLRLLVNRILFVLRMESVNDVLAFRNFKAHLSFLVSTILLPFFASSSRNISQGFTVVTEIPKDYANCVVAKHKNT